MTACEQNCGSTYLITLGDVTLLSRIYIGDFFKEITLATATCDSHYCTSTLGGMTQIGSPLFYVAPPKVAVKGIEIIVN